MMKLARTPFLLAGIALVLIGASAVLFKGGRSAHPDVQHPRETSDLATPENAGAGISLAPTDGRGVPIVSSGQTAEVATQTKSQIPQQGSSNFEFSQELSSYAKIKEKIFSTDEDRLERSRLILNPSLIRSLEAVLKIPVAVGSADEKQQNSAIDLLLEAQAAGSSEATSVLRSVIEDQRIEDTSTDLKVRESLAGVKAEILFQWSAQEPRLVQDVQSWLPGPVSQKIWENVLANQSQNAAESGVGAARDKAR